MRKSWYIVVGWVWFLVFCGVLQMVVNIVVTVSANRPNPIYSYILCVSYNNIYMHFLRNLFCLLLSPKPKRGIFLDVFPCLQAHEVLRQQRYQALRSCSYCYRWSRCPQDFPCIFHKKAKVLKRLGRRCEASVKKTIPVHWHYVLFLKHIWWILMYNDGFDLVM